MRPTGRENAQQERELVTTFRAALNGTSPLHPGAGRRPLSGRELALAAMHDPDIYRLATRTHQLLTDLSTLTDPATIEHVRELVPAEEQPPDPAVPTRADLAELLNRLSRTLPPLTRTQFLSPTGSWVCGA